MSKPKTLDSRVYDSEMDIAKIKEDVKDLKEATGNLANLVDKLIDDNIKLMKAMVKK